MMQVLAICKCCKGFAENILNGVVGKILFEEMWNNRCCELIEEMQLIEYYSIMSMQESFTVLACFHWLRRGKLRPIMLTACLVQIFSGVGMKEFHWSSRRRNLREISTTTNQY